MNPHLWSKGTAEKIIDVNNWCKGFVRAILLGAWATLPAALYDYLRPVVLYDLPKLQDERDRVPPEDYKQAPDDIKLAVIRIMAHRLTQHQRLKQEQTALAKIGRNDPCPLC